jgi:hypothetical protein
MSSQYLEPLAKSFPLVAVLNPGAYSNSTYATSPVLFGQCRQILATVAVGNNITSSSVINAYLQYSSVSSASTFTTLDAVNAALNFGGATGQGTLPGSQKSLEIRAETLARLPVNAATYVRLSVTLSSSASTTEFGAWLQAGYYRFPPSVGVGTGVNGSLTFLSSSLSNVIYASANNGGTIPVI